MPIISTYTLRRLLENIPKTPTKHSYLGLESTCVNTLDWVPTVEEGISGDLTVVFHKRGTYVYHDVPLDTFVDFSMAESQGQFFNLYIKDHYSYDRTG